VSFLVHLKALAEHLEDLSGLAIADADGIVVEEYPTNSNIEMPSLVAEYGALLKPVNQAGLSSDLGSMCECCISTEKARLVIREISEGYFLLLALSSEKDLGKGRFYSRLAAEALALELES